GDVIHAVVGDVADRDAALAGRVEIDIVDSDPVADDELRAVHRRDDDAADGGELRQHEFGSADGGDQLLGRLALARIERTTQRREDVFLDPKVRKAVVGDHDLAHVYWV